MLRSILSTSISVASVASIIFTAACGKQTAASSSASLQDDLERERAVTLSCKGSMSPVDQLALELSKECRKQNAELRAKGMPACLQDECTDLVTLKPAQKGLTGTQFIHDSQGNTVGFSVEISSDIRLSAQEKHGLICYAPALKAEELLGSSAVKCK
jgi:hypothetical protein